MTILIKYLKKISPVVLALFFTLGLTAQNQDETRIRTTQKGTSYKVMGWETNVAYNPRSYTWYAWQEPLVKEMATKKVSLIPVSKFDRPPLFDGYCLTEKEMFECSNKKLQEYMNSEAIKYPLKAAMNEQEGLEYVTFTLTEEGKIGDDIRVLSKEKPCKGCSDAAADLIAGMEDMWYPAILNGEAVKTQLTIPVRFKLLEK